MSECTGSGIKIWCLVITCLLATSALIFAGVAFSRASEALDAANTNTLTTQAVLHSVPSSAKVHNNGNNKKPSASLQEAEERAALIEAAAKKQSKFVHQQGIANANLQQVPVGRVAPPRKPAQASTARPTESRTESASEHSEEKRNVKSVKPVQLARGTVKTAPAKSADPVLAEPKPLKQAKRLTVAERMSLNGQML